MSGVYRRELLAHETTEIYRYQDGLCVWLWLKLTYCSEIFQETVSEGNVSQGYQGLRKRLKQGENMKTS